MPDIIDALDTFLEAAGKYSKARALKPVQRKLEKGMAKAFTSQGRAFLKEFKKYEASWPVQESNRKLREAFITIDDLEEIFSKKAVASIKLFADPLDVAVHQALMSGSAAIISQLGFDISFDLKNPRAVTYIKAHGAELVTQMGKTTQGELRTVIEYGVDHGWSYSETAQAIQRRFTSYYDTKSQWNMTAPRPQGHIDSRAHLIAVTESGEAYETGNYLVIEDMKADGLTMEKKWSTMKDDVVSEGCQENEAEGWIPSDQAHASGHMHPLRFPGCLPGGQRVVADNVLGATKRFFDGEIVIIRTSSGNELSCTPNHPILTPKGWIGAGLLNVGSDVVCAFAREFSETTPNVDKQQRPSLIEEVARTFGSSGEVRSEIVKVSPPDFHGDGKGSQVAVVWANCLLDDRRNKAIRKQIEQQGFAWANIRWVFLSGISHLATLVEGVLSSACCIMSSFGIPRIFFWSASGHHQSVSIGRPAHGDAEFNQPFSDEIAAYPISLSQGNRSFAGKIAGNDFVHWQRDIKRIGSLYVTSVETVIDVCRVAFSGHVYNLQTEQEFYVAEGIVTHNCRCDELYRRAK